MRHVARRGRSVVSVMVFVLLIPLLPGAPAAAQSTESSSVVMVAAQGAAINVGGSQVQFAPQPDQGMVVISADSFAPGDLGQIPGAQLSAQVLTVRATDPTGLEVNSFPHAFDVVPADGTGTPEYITSFQPGVVLTLPVPPSAEGTVAPETVAVYRRANATDSWQWLPSAYDASQQVVEAHADELGEFMVFGEFIAPTLPLNDEPTGDAPPPGAPTVVLDPDNDIGFAVWPDGRESELARNLQLVGAVGPRLVSECGANVVVTRDATPIVDASIRAAVARNAAPDLSVTLAFNAVTGQPFGSEADGGVRAWATSDAVDGRLAEAFLQAVPAFTGRPSRQPVNGGNAGGALPYSSFADVPGPHAHIEVLFLDHRFDRPVLVNNFGSVVDATVSALLSQLDALGYECGGVQPPPPPPPPVTEASLVVDTNGPTRLADGNYRTVFEIGNLAPADREPVQNASLRLSVGAGGELATVPSGCTAAGAGEFTCSIGTLAGGATTTLNADFVQQTSAFTVGWVVTADNTPSESGSFTIPARAVVPPPVDVSVSLSIVSPGSGDVVRPGTSFPIGVRVANNAATDLNPAAAGLSLSLTFEGGGPGTVPFGAELIPAGQSLLVSATGIAPSATSFDVVAVLSGDALAAPIRATRTVRTSVYGVPQFVGDGFGAGAIAGYTAGTSTVADPVQVATGNFLQPETDLDFGASVFGMTVGRFYNSAAITEADENAFTVVPLGPGWRFSHSITAALDDEGVVTITAGDGRVLRFVPTADGAPKPFDRPPLFYGDLYVVDGLYVIANYDGTRWLFDDQLRVNAMTAPDGQRVAINFENDQIASIVSSTGLRYQLTYVEAGLARIDSTDGTNMGRFVEFRYNADGHLSEAVDPDGEVVTYATDDGGLIERINDQAGVLILDNTYDEFGRVVLQENGAGEIAKFIYLAEELVTRVEITAATGEGIPRTDTYVYEHNDLGFTIDITDPLDEHIVTVRDPASNEPSVVADRRSTASGQQDPAGFPSIRTAREFDDFGNILSETIPELGTWGYTYLYTEQPNGQGSGLPQVRLETVTPPWDAGDGSSATRYFYTGTNNVPSRIEGPLGLVVTNEIVDGLVVASTDSDGVTTRIEHNQHRRPVAIVDGVGNRSELFYDMEGRVTEFIDPSLSSTALTYDETGRPLSLLDREGAATTWSYDPAGRITEFHDPLETDDAPSMVAYDYDPLSGLMTSRNDQRSNAAAFSWNGFSQLTSVSLPGNEADAADDVATYVYQWEELGRRTAVTDPLPQGRTTSFEYDAEGQIERLVGADPATNIDVQYDEADRPVRTEDANGLVATMTYDPTTGLLSSRSYGVGTADEITIGYAYDAAARVSAISGPRDGEATFFTYTPAGRLDTVSDAVGVDAAGVPVVDMEYVYDAAGRVSNIITPGTAPEDQLVSEFFYDENSRVTATLSPLDLRYSASYDNDDRLDSTSLPSGVTTEFGYNNNDAPTSVALGTDTPVRFDVDSLVINGSTDANGGVASYGYDDRYNMTSRIDQRGNTTRYEFDEADQLTAMIDPLGRSASMQYDLIGRLVATADASGRTWTSSHDDGGRLSAITFADGSTQSFSYDFLNRITAVTDQPENTSTTFGYDAAGNLTSVTEPDGDTIAYSWDTANNRTSITYPDGSVVRYVYDAQNRLTAADSDAYGLTEYFYDDDSRLTDVIFPDKSTRSYGYTGEQLTSFNDGGKGWKLDYDTEGRLERITGSDHWEFDYDDGGQLVSATHNGRTWTYSHDAVGNLIQVDDSEGIDTSYTHDMADQLATVTSNEVSSSFVHDEAGRLTQEPLANGDVVNYTYDIRGRLETVATTQPPVAVLDGVTAYVTSVDTGRHLHADRWGNVVQSATTHRQSSEWVFERLDNGYFALRNADSGRYLDVDDWRYHHNVDTADGIRSDREWELIQQDDGSFQLRNPLTDRYLDADSYRWFNVDTTVRSSGVDTLWTIVAVDESQKPEPLVLESRTETWTRTYTPDGLLGSVTQTSLTGGTSTWEMTWDRTLGAAQPLGWSGADDITLVHGVGPALTVTSGKADAIELGPLGDVIGSPVATAASFDPFGTSDSTTFGLGYRGELHIGPTIYLKHRDLIPSLHRFSTTDPLTAPVGSSVTTAYAYASNDPVNLVDPLGLAPSDSSLAGLTPITNPFVGAGVIGNTSPTVSDEAAEESSCPWYSPGLICSGGERLANTLSAAYWGYEKPPTIESRVTGLPNTNSNEWQAAIAGLEIGGGMTEVFYGLPLSDTTTCVLEEDGSACAWAAGQSALFVAGAAASRASAAAGPTRSVTGTIRRWFTGACSFSGQTRVLMADGSTKPISEVEVGDSVLAADPETGKRGMREVTHLIVHEDTLIDLEIAGHTVTTTEDHPFWNHTDSEWQRADDLDTGDLVLTSSGATLTIEGFDWTSERSGTAYNLTVDDIHTYFVAAGANEVLVHNVCVNKGTASTSAPGLSFAHGTSSQSAPSVVSGLSETSGAGLTRGGQYAQPGSFHTFSMGDQEGLQLAYEMGLRHGPDCVVVVCNLPTSTYDDIVRSGDVVVEPIPGVSIPQVVFGPGSFDRINENATWNIIKPGG